MTLATPEHEALTRDVSSRKRPRWRVLDLTGAGALLLYSALSLVFFGRTLLRGLSTFHIGAGPDPAAMMWFLAWWPYAISHGMNPFLSRQLWAPIGINLAWQTSVPLASVLAFPLTASFGPVISYNVLCLLSVALDAWCAFVLCRYLTRDYWASLLGGYIFGFSAYVLSHLAYGHLALLLVFPIPLAAYLVARRVNDEITTERFVGLFAGLLSVQFWLWPEGCATLTMFGASGLCVGWIFAEKRWRGRLQSLLIPMALSYGIALIAISPYLYYFFAYGFRAGTTFPPLVFSADLLNFVVPTRLNEIGRMAPLEGLSSRFMGGWLAENSACLSVPLVAIAIVYSRERRRDPLARTLIYGLVIVCVLALGPVLHVAGLQLPFALPWLLFVHIPVLDNALPARFPLYAFLILAVISSVWLAESRDRRTVRVGLAIAVVLFNLPNVSSKVWGAAFHTPAFFRGGIYRQYLRPAETIITLPFGYAGELWQMQTGMYFNLAEGYSAGRPLKFQAWPISAAFKSRSFVPEAAWQLRAFLEGHDVKAIVVTDSAFATWQSVLSGLGVTPGKVADIRLYRLPPAEAGGQAVPTVTEAISRFNLDRFAALVVAAEKYLSSGGRLDSLSVLELEKLKLIPKGELIGPPIPIRLGAAPFPNVITDPHNADGVYLNKSRDGRVLIGVFAWRPARLIESLEGLAAKVYFPYPAVVSEKGLASDSADHGVLVAEFTREELARAATILKTLAPLDEAGAAGNGAGPSLHR